MAEELLFFFFIGESRSYDTIVRQFRWPYIGTVTKDCGFRHVRRRHQLAYTGTNDSYRVTACPRRQRTRISVGDFPKTSFRDSSRRVQYHRGAVNFLVPVDLLRCRRRGCTRVV